MTINANPWTSDKQPLGTLVKLVQVPPDVLDALADGNVEKAGTLTDLGLTPYLTSAECRGVWILRRKQIARDPSEANVGYPARC